MTRHQGGHDLIKKRLRLAELIPMAHRAPDDAPQHIAAALVRRHHAIDDQEAAGADMIGDHAQRGR
jgi:hypothetical protein